MQQNLVHIWLSDKNGNIAIKTNTQYIQNLTIRNLTIEDHSLQQAIQVAQQQWKILLSNYEPIKIYDFKTNDKQKKIHVQGYLIEVDEEVFTKTLNPSLFQLINYDDIDPIIRPLGKDEICLESYASLLIEMDKRHGIKLENLHRYALMR